MSDSADIVTRALRRLQAIDINEQPSASEMSHALNVMGEMVNGWTAKGINTTTQTLVGDVVSGDDRVRNITTDTSSILRNLTVTGTGIPTNAIVKEVITDTVFQLSAVATANAGAATLTFAFLPIAAAYEGALVALLAVRLSEDLGLPVSAKLQMDSVEGWSDLLSGYFPDRKVKFDRSIAAPAGLWDANTDWVI